MKLDFSKFKKIQTDDKCTTLQHPSGHSIKISHKDLSEESRKQLDEAPVHLAKGGYAKYAQKYDPNVKSKNSKPAQPAKAAPQDAYTPPKEAAKAFTEPDNAGTDPYDDIVIKALNKQAPPMGALGAEKPMYPPCINPSCKSYGRSHPNCRCYGGNEHVSMNFAEGGKVDDFCSQDRTHNNGCEYFAMGTPEPVGTAPGHEEQQPAMPSETPAPASPSSPEGSSPNPEWQGSYGVATPIAEAEPSSQPQQQMEESPGEQDPYKNFQKEANYAHQFMHDQSNKFYSDVDAGHIDPKTYKDLMPQSTLGKIGTIFGLLVGGAGAGLAHQDNALLGLMNNEINNNLKAQEMNQSNRRSLLALNGQNLMNEAHAGRIGAETAAMKVAMSKDQANYLYYDYLAKQAMKLPDGPQKQLAMQKLSFLKDAMISDKASGFAKASQAYALGQQLKGGGNTMVMKSGLMGPELKEAGADMETKTIPGIPGTANRPVPQENRDEIQAMNVLDNKAADILAFAKAHKGTLSPSQRKIGEQKAEELVNYYNNSIKGGVLTQGRLEWLDKQIKKNPTSIFQDILGNNARLQEIKSSNANRREILLNSLGLRSGASSGGSHPHEGKTATNSQGQKIIMKNGKWHPHG